MTVSVSDVPAVNSTPESSSVDIAASGDRVHVRMFHYNDCYEIVHLPCLKAAMDSLALDESIPGNKNIRLMAGDFLAPSVLSSVDEGECMIDCMNDLKLDFTTIGNHEQDVSLQAAVSRVKQSNFAWINSNISNLPAEFPPMPDRMFVEVDTGTGHARKIAFIGTLCNDPGLYKPGAFWGAKIMPTFDTVMNMYEEIMTTQPGASPVDVFVPVTHQYMPPDRLLARKCEGKFPLILGGHDHSPFVESHDHAAVAAPKFSSTTIVKAAMDGQYVSVCDVVWDSRSDATPDVSVQMVAVKNFSPDQALLEKVQSHSKRLLGQLEAAKIMPMPKNLGPLTSKDIRVAQRSMGTFITNNIRDGFMADCFAMASGSIRRGHEYEASHEVFSFRDLVSECPFVDNCRVINIPGKVFSEMVAYSRSGKKFGTGGYMQLCDRITYVEGEGVTHIAGEPLVADKIYRVVSTCAAIDGVDDHIPLVQWLAEGSKLGEAPLEPCLRKLKSGCEPLPAEGHPDLVLQKQALLRFAARKVVVDYLEKHPFGEGASSEEAAIPLAKFEQIYPDQPEWFLTNVWQHLDWDNDGKLGVVDLGVILCTVWLAQVQQMKVEELKARLQKTLGAKQGDLLIEDILNDPQNNCPEEAETNVVTRNMIGMWYLRVLARLTANQ